MPGSSRHEYFNKILSEVEFQSTGIQTSEEKFRIIFAAELVYLKRNHA